MDGKDVALAATMRLDHPEPVRDKTLAHEHAPLHLRENRSQMQERRVSPKIGASHHYTPQSYRLDPAGIANRRVALLNRYRVLAN